MRPANQQLAAQFFLSLRSTPPSSNDLSRFILLWRHAARHASRPPTPSREKRACRGPASPQTQENSVGEQSTGACIGTPFCSCLVIRGYASAAAGCVGPAELPLCAALIRGGSISCHPPPTEKYGQGTKRPRVADLNRSLSRLPEVTVIYATDRNLL